MFCGRHAARLPAECVERFGIEVVRLELVRVVNRVADRLDRALRGELAVEAVVDQERSGGVPPAIEVESRAIRSERSLASISSHLRVRAFSARTPSITFGTPRLLGIAEDEEPDGVVCVAASRAAAAARRERGDTSTLRTTRSDVALYRGEEQGGEARGPLSGDFYLSYPLTFGSSVRQMLRRGSPLDHALGAVLPGGERQVVDRHGRKPVAAGSSSSP